MGVHVYCVVPRDHALPSGLSGIDGAAVATVQGDTVALWVTSHETPPPAAIEAIRQHHAVVAAAMTATVTPVPIRFGQWFDDAAAARAASFASHEKWVGLLQKFAGAEEYGIRIFDPDQTEETPGARPATGTAYMEALARRAAGPAGVRTQALEALHEELGDLPIEEIVEPLKTVHGVASVAHLVHATRRDAYRDAVDAARNRVPALRLLSTGPWPPYSFVA